MKQNVKVWDGSIRLFHWVLVLAIAFMWFSAETGGNWLVWHLRCGLLILGLLVFRVLWGIWGSDTARFVEFVRGPAEIKQYLSGQWQENQHPGHNPLGALMVLALLGGLFFQVFTGLFASDENTFLNSGYLAGWISESASSTARTLHTTFFNVLITLIVIHVATVLFYKWVKKHDLIRPMITGYKSLANPASLHFAGIGKWLLTILLAIAVVALIYFLKR